MCTLSSSNLIVESFTIPKRRNRRRSKQIIKPELRTIVETLVDTMADMRTMSELLQAPTEGYGDAIRDDPHSHIRWFNNITSTLKYKNVPHEAIKLMLLPFSLEGAARIWLEKEPPRSIHTWEDLVSKFVNYFFPPSKTTNIKNDITNFQQRFDETFSKAWDCFKDLLSAGGNLLNRTPRDALTIIENKSKVRTSRNKPVVSKVSATTSSSTPAYLPEITALTDVVKAMLLQNKTPSPAPVKAIEEICVTCGGPHPYYECLATDGNTFNASAATGTYNQGGPGYRPQGETNYRASNQMRPPGFPQPNVQNNQNRYNQNQGYNQNKGYNQNQGNHFNQGNQNYHAPFYQTQVGPSNVFSNYMKTNDINELKNDIKNMMSSYFQMNSPSGSGSLHSNTIANPRGDLKAITTRSGVSYDGHTIPTTSSPLPKEVECEPEATKDRVETTNLGSTTHVQPRVVQVPILEPNFAPKPNPKPSIPYPSWLNDQKLCEKANNQMLKFLQIFQRLHFDLNFADALFHIPKFASTFKSLLSNKEKLFEWENTLLNENSSAVLLKKLPEKPGDSGKFLIPYDFPELDECLALADLGASINLIPLSVWKKLSLSKLTHTRMTLELANRSVAYPVGVAEYVIVKVGKFHFLANFVVVDYDVDPHVPLILGRPFLRTARALVDVYGEELILREGDEKLIFHADNTSKHPQKHANELINMINFIDITCEDRFPEVLKKSTHPSSGSTTPLSNSLPSLTPFETSDSLLEEFADELVLLDPFPLGIGDADFDSKGDILLLEKLLNDDPSSPLPPKELNFEKLRMIKSSIDDSPPLDVLGGNSVTFSNPLFDTNDDFTSSDNESLLGEDVLKDIENKDSYVSNLDEPALLVTPLSDEDECFDPGGDINEIDADVSMDIKDDYHDSTKEFGESQARDSVNKNKRFSGGNPCFYLLFLFSNKCDVRRLASSFLVFRGLCSMFRIAPDYEDSRARGFVHRSLELQSLACLYMGIRYPRSY
ncbi:reverse transcriptase domain-containing protein [Tanacetum coccineum]